MHRRFAVSALSMLLISAGGSAASTASEPSRSSALHVALVQGNLAQAVRDQSSGEYRGVSIDVAQEFGRRCGRPIEVSMLSPAAILEAVARGEVDLGFVAPNPDRIGQVLYSQTYMLVQQTTAVPDDSPLRSVADLDRPGQRIGANTGDSVAGYLARTLHYATVVESSDITMREALSWLRNGTVVAFAGNRQRLGVSIRGIRGLHLLPDNFYAVPQAVAVSRSRPELLIMVDTMLGEMRTSGFLETAVQRSGADGIAVAASPPEEGVKAGEPEFRSMGFRGMHSCRNCKRPNLDRNRRSSVQNIPVRWFRDENGTSCFRRDLDAYRSLDRQADRSKVMDGSKAAIG